VNLAAKKARRGGVGVAVIRRGGHIGAAGVFALERAEAGDIAIVMSTTSRIMTVEGSSERTISNAPIAYGIPNRSFPIVFDSALSVVAGQRVFAAAAAGVPIPEGWIITADGRPSSDPADYVERGGALLPVGGHKGSGLALLVEVLAAALSGAAVCKELGFLQAPEEPTDVGQAIVVIRPEAFVSRCDFEGAVHGLVAALHAARPTPGTPSVRLPGEDAHRREQLAVRDGLMLPCLVWSDLAAVAEGRGAALLNESLMPHSAA
jgi:LDH2 family malate/lactate/ureidoglycolate dehydrogenase